MAEQDKHNIYREEMHISWLCNKLQTHGTVCVCVCVCACVCVHVSMSVCVCMCVIMTFKQQAHAIERIRDTHTCNTVRSAGTMLVTL